MMPTFIQFSGLTPGHFESHAVWVSCHSFDHDEPWYDQIDEETFRAWAGVLPVHAGAGMFLVSARLRLADGSVLPGFATPFRSEDVPDDGALGQFQPHVFLPSGEFIGFWLGIVGDPLISSAALYKALGKPAESVFPLQVTVEPEHWLNEGPVTIKGFYRVTDGRVVCVSR